MRLPDLLIPALLVSTPLASQTTPGPGPGPEPVTGNAATDAGLVSRGTAGEVRLLTDAGLNDGRAAIRLLVTNRGTVPQPFGPDAVAVSADGRPVALATRAGLLGLEQGRESTLRETAQGRATAALPVNSAGQTDVGGYTGGMGGNMGGVPGDSVGRAGRARGKAVDPAYAAQLDAVLLKPATVAPGAATSGQLFTDKLKRRARQLDVTVTFAGEAHRFRIDAPR